MWIEIENDIFQKSDFKGLNYLYQILSWYPSHSIPRYKIFIDLPKVESTPNYEKLKIIETGLKELLESQFDEFITSNPKNCRPNHKITYKSGKNCFNIEEAIRFYSQPISIILENNKNDSCFIIAIIHHFDKNGMAKEHLKNGWIRFENAGGCSNTANFVDGFLEIFRDLAAKNSRDLSDYFRGLIVLDSDKEHSTDPQKSQYTTLLTNLALKGIKNIHILEKRMMENYMPDDVFIDLKNEFGTRSRNKDLVDWINVYLYLNNDQKNYLKYYDGFNDDLVRLDRNVQILYSGLSLKQFGILKEGFKYKGKNFKNQFPLLFLESDKVNRHTLNLRAGSGELEDILEKINNLL